MCAHSMDFILDRPAAIWKKRASYWKFRLFLPRRLALEAEQLERLPQACWGSGFVGQRVRLGKQHVL